MIILNQTIDDEAQPILIEDTDNIRTKYSLVNEERLKEEGIEYVRSGLFRLIDGKDYYAHFLSTPVINSFSLLILEQGIAPGIQVSRNFADVVKSLDIKFKNPIKPTILSVEFGPLTVPNPESNLIYVNQIIEPLKSIIELVKKSPRSRCMLIKSSMNAEHRKQGDSVIQLYSMIASKKFKLNIEFLDSDTAYRTYPEYIIGLHKNSHLEF